MKNLNNTSQNLLLSEAFTLKMRLMMSRSFGKQSMSQQPLKRIMVKKLKKRHKRKIQMVKEVMKKKIKRQKVLKK